LVLQQEIWELVNQGNRRRTIHLVLKL